METNQLRQGNFIGQIYYNPNPKNPQWLTNKAIVVGVLKNDIYVNLFGEKRTVRCGKDSYLPLDIDDTWLRKFGFVEIVSDQKPFVDKKAYVLGTDASRIIWSGNCIAKVALVGFKILNWEVKYVHRLQNICFELNNEELFYTE